MATKESTPIVEPVFDNITSVDGDSRRLPDAQEIEIARSLTGVDAVRRNTWRSYFGHIRAHTSDVSAMLDAISEHTDDAEITIKQHGSEETSVVIDM